jgi:integrase
MAIRTKHTTSDRPIKPRPDFPLFPHSTGRWAKKISGKLHYFGPWCDPNGAYQRYLRYKESLRSDGEPGRGETGDSGKTSQLNRRIKPWPGFPLYAHPSGQWAKKIRGRTHYFGTDAEVAFRRYQEQKDDLDAGRTPKTGNDYRLTVKDMVNLCLTVKASKLQSSELHLRTYKEYKRCGRRLLRVLGRERLVEDLAPTDFLKLRRDMTKTLKSLSSIKADIRKMMVFFNFAYEEGYIDRAVRTGEGFRSPTASALRRERQQKDERMFQAEQIRAMLAKANPQMKAMILLGINCAFGNTDCVMLTKNKLDLEGGWVSFARPTTGVRRCCPLWSQTVEALKVVLAQESKHPEYRNRVFIVDKRKPRANHIDDGRRISKYFRLLLDSLEIPKDSPNFYAFRHTFVTIALQARDREAVRTITGHGPPSGDMLNVYNEDEVSASRLVAVSNYVRDWLFKTESPSSAAAVGEQSVSAAQRVAGSTSKHASPEMRQKRRR